MLVKCHCAYTRFLLSIRLGRRLDPCLYKEDYLHILNVCPFDCMSVAGGGGELSHKMVIHTSCMTVVIPTDRPKLIRNYRCIILCEFFCWYRACS